MKTRPHRIAALLLAVLVLATATRAADPAPVRGLTAVARPLAPAERAGEKVDADGSAGLFVGVGAFDPASGLADLRYTPDDAVALAHLFSLELGLIPAPRVRLALAGAPRSARAKQAFAELKAAGAKVGDAQRLTLLDALDETVRLASAPDGMLVVSFGSHGFEEKGSAYIMPSDGRRKYVGSTGVPLQSVKDTLREARANKRILILDACRETLGSDVRGEGRMDAALRGALKASEGFAVVASCGAGQLSWESPELEQGVFTHFLLEAARGAAGADSPDGFIRLGQVSAHATRATRDWVQAQKREVQEPWFEGELARSIPLAVHPAALERREAARADAAKLESRRIEGRRLLALAVAEDTEGQFPPDTLSSVRGALARLSGKDLDELLRELDALSENTPRNRRIFAQYWKDRRSTIGSAAPVVAAGGTQGPSSTAILDSLRLPEDPKPTNRRPLTLADLQLRARPPRLPAASAATPWTNELGMAFVPVPGTRVLMSVFETRRGDYKAYARSGGTADTNWVAPFFVGARIPLDDDVPVIRVNWEDARGFCAWLTRHGRAAGLFGTNLQYRLPTDLEWSRAAGLAVEDGRTPSERGEKSAKVYPWGTEFPPTRAVGNYHDRSAPLHVAGQANDLGDYDDGFKTLAPAGRFPANVLGLHDLGGNVAEMCQDAWTPLGTKRVARGGTWLDSAEPKLRSGARRDYDPSDRSLVLGFRVVLAEE